MIRRNMNGYIAVIVALGIGLTANAATVRVTGGTLCLGNKLSATNFILGSAASMKGNGEIRAPATLAGTVSPGSSTENIGTLSFSDLVTFDSGSFVCYAATATSLDRISVTGDVAGAATVNMSRATGVAPLRQVIINGGTLSDYDSFGVSPSTAWALGEMNTLDLIVSLGQLPSIPQNVSASDGTYSYKVALSWNASSDVSAYQVWRNTVNNSSSATLLGTTEQINYNDTDSAVAVTYYYWIKATNTISTSAFSSSDSGWRASVSSGVCADYDGDGKADPAVYDETTGTWKVKLSSLDYYMLTTPIGGIGGPGYASVAADYDGDRKADPAVYRELTGRWAIMLSSANYEVLIVLAQPLGGPGYSGMPADYDGDTKADPGVYQREQGNWQVMLSSGNYTKIEVLGLLGGTGYQAVAADYDGDGTADPAVYGIATGDWKIMFSSADYWTLTLTGFLGGTGYIPVPADYDGDGLTDPAVRSETSNEWIIMFSTGDYTPVTLTIAFE